MKSTWRKHIIICLFLGLLAVPIYFLCAVLFVPWQFFEEEPLFIEESPEW
jgi:hypothetical protein